MYTYLRSVQVTTKFVCSVSDRTYNMQACREAMSLLARVALECCLSPELIGFCLSLIRFRVEFWGLGGLVGLGLQSYCWSHLLSRPPTGSFTAYIAVQPKPTYASSKISFQNVKFRKQTP